MAQRVRSIIGLGRVVSSSKISPRKVSIILPSLTPDHDSRQSGSSRAGRMGMRDAMG